MITLERTASERQEIQSDSGFQSPEMQRRAAAVRSFRDSYWSLMNRTGFGSKSSTQETIKWLDDMKLTDDKNEKKSIYWREDFISKDGSLVMKQGESLYQKFTSYMSDAAPYISKASHKRWFERLYDTREQSSSTSSFKMKLAWVESELGNYVDRWKKVAKDRDDLVKNPQFKELVESEPDLAILSNRDKFLDLHYTERRGLASKALALINAKSTARMAMFTTAKGKLESAAGKKNMLDGKVGVWLERIFKSKADPKKIAEFVNGSGPKSLEGLIQNWAAVKDRFDKISQKAKERGQDSAARGFALITSPQFLSMHYAQRLSYVKQGEERLEDAHNVVNELPIFLKIRHAMDMKEWSEAAKLIEAAKLMQLKETDWPRLKSMEKHVSQFRGNSQGTTTPKNSLDHANKIEQAKKQLDVLMESFSKSHSEAYPLVLRLLKGPNANRSIRQLSWIWYNNIWCRTHGPPYLNDEIARKGSSEESARLTKYRAEQGQDIGRHDTLDKATSDSTYFRKEEVSKHKATFIHANLTDGGVTSALAEKLEHEQDPRWLYWNSLCPFGSKDDPKPESWMREGLSILIPARALIRTINSGGCMYDEPGRALISMN